MKTTNLTLTDAVIEPARLVKITRRDGTILRIAEAQSSIVVDGNTFTPIAGLEISSVRSTLGGDVPSMEIVGAHSDGGTIDTAVIDKGLYDSALVQLWVVDRASLPSTLSASEAFFTGTIQPVAYDIAGSFSFDIRGHAVQASGAFIQNFAPMCRTDLFSPLCGLTAASFAKTCTVDTIINNHNFTVSGMASPPADGWFNNGVVLTSDGVSFTAAHWDLSDLQVTAYLPCRRFLTAGQSLTLYPGCDKRIATCLSKFANTANFQGEPHSLGIYAAIAGG